MSDPTSLLRNAELALAAFATFVDGNTASDANIDALSGAAGVGMVPTQALRFASFYPTVVGLFDDRPNTGFQVAVFKDTAGAAPGNLSIAFRGVNFSDDPLDFSAALDIGGFGVAYEQIVAMVNWWRRASAPVGEMVQQFRLSSYPAAGVPSSAVIIREN